jgi:hypothetical protein
MARIIPACLGWDFTHKKPLKKPFRKVDFLGKSIGIFMITELFETNI